MSLLTWHCMLQLIDLGRDKMGQTIDNTWRNHKQHQYGDNKNQQGHQPTPNSPSPGESPKQRLQPPGDLFSQFFEILQGTNVFLQDCETFLNLAGGLQPEKKTHLIQDGSSPSLFRDQEIYLLSILECNTYQAVLALQSCPEGSHSQKLSFGGVYQNSTHLQS